MDNNGVLECLNIGYPITFERPDCNVTGQGHSSIDVTWCTDALITNVQDWHVITAARHLILGQLILRQLILRHLIFATFDLRHLILDI